MILVVLGTFPIEFKRPLLEIDKLCKEGNITEEVIVQNGHTKIMTNHLNCMPFMSPEILSEFYENARLIISHAGTGSLIKGVKLNKKVIAIARLAKFGEHIDNHQVEILEEFAKMGYILPWREHDALKDVLKTVENFTPNKYISNKQTIIDYLTDYIDSV